jgi:heme-based aerotactic transducer
MLDVDEVVDGIRLDRGEIRWRKDFVNFGPQDEKHLSGMEEMCRENAEQVADDFYENLSQYDETVEVISRSDKALDAFKRTQSACLVTLATGDYDMSYLRRPTAEPPRMQVGSPPWRVPPDRGSTRRLIVLRRYG